MKEAFSGMKRLASMLLALLLAVLPAALAEAAELSGYYGQDIAQAAEAIGGLTYEAGDEFKDNYTGDGLALRGDGTVRLIDLTGGADRYALCGVTVGMKRDDALKGLAGYSQLWDYDEEAAFIIVADEADQLNSQTLVLFFEDGAVSGAWYRSSEE